MKYENLITNGIRLSLLKHVEKTLAVSNRRPANEITDALLSWDRAFEHFHNLESSIGPVRGKKLLEIGSGFGLFLAIALSKGAKATGLEPSKNKSYSLTNKISMELLKKAGFNSKAVKIGFGERLPFNDSSFDIVCSFYTLEHVKNVKKVLKESVRVTKPGGYIFFEVPNYGSFWEGHYGILWVPYLTRKLAKYYVKLWGKEGKLIDELQFINLFLLRKACRDLPVTIIETGKKMFKKKLTNLEFTSVGTLTSAIKILRVLKKIGILTILTDLACIAQAQTPIIFVIKKNAK